MSGGLGAAVERGLSSLLALDSRVLERVDPVVDHPLDPSSFPWSVALANDWRVVRAELDTALRGGVVIPETDQVIGRPQGAHGRWSTFVLRWYGRTTAAALDRFPSTSALLGTIPHLQIAGFTVLGPGSHIPAHRGPSRSYRYHLGVIVPGPPGSCRLRLGSTTVAWAEGESLAFDDRTEHEAWNDSDETRYVLFAQTAWPASGARGVLHRVADRALAASTSDVLRRSEELDFALNRPVSGE